MHLTPSNPECPRIQQQECPRLESRLLESRPSVKPDVKTNTKINNHEDSEELSKQVRQSLQLEDRKTSNRSKRDDDDCLESIPSKKAKSCVTETSSQETEEEVAELAGYLDELYLPRDAVSADVALMADLMYT